MNFKKIIFIIILIPFLGISQKFKTKKDRILVDEKEVAILNDKMRDTYEFSDLNSQKKFVVE